jgi:hypothetical protein
MQGIDKDVVTTMRHPVARGVIGVGALLLLGIAALGGFREAQSRQPPLPRVGVGQVASSDAFQITPLCAYATDQMPGRRHPDAGKRYLVLRARVVNRMEMDWSGHLQKDVVWPADGSGSAAPAQWVLRADDHSLFPQFPPGIPALVELVWPLAPGAAAPGRWGLYQRVRMRRHLDTGENAWLQQAPGTLLLVPVGARCAQVAA